MYEMKPGLERPILFSLLLSLCPSSSSAIERDVLLGTERSAALQSSTFNKMAADRALDADPETCSMTGYGDQNWWMHDLKEVITVKGITLIGSADTFNIRVGNISRDVGTRDDVHKNPLCATIVNDLADGQATSYKCRVALTGQYLSIHSADSGKHTRMTLCDVQIF